MRCSERYSEQKIHYNTIYRLVTQQEQRYQQPLLVLFSSSSSSIFFHSLAPAMNFAHGIWVCCFYTYTSGRCKNKHNVKWKNKCCYQSIRAPHWSTDTPTQTHIFILHIYVIEHATSNKNWQKKLSINFSIHWPFICHQRHQPKR